VQWPAAFRSPLFWLGVFLIFFGLYAEDRGWLHFGGEASTAVGAIFALLGAIDRIVERSVQPIARKVEEGNAQLGECIDALGDRLSDKIDGVSSKIDTLSTKMDTLSAKVDRVGDRLGEKLDAQQEVLIAIRDRLPFRAAEPPPA
jgi:outer membrane murein-binding lipoprotein Lpp